MENPEKLKDTEQQEKKLDETEVKVLISSAVTLKICGDLNITDNVDAMRVNIFAMELSNIVYENLDASDEKLFEKVKESRGFKGMYYNVTIGDETLKDVIKQAKGIKELWDKK